MNRRVILASASPRRKQLLESAGIIAEVEAADIDEAHGDGEEAARYVARMARQKAEAVAERHLGEESLRGAVVVGADTIVVADGTILGKPSSAADAFSMLKRLIGRCHDVMTSVAIADLSGARPLWRQFVVTTRVEFGEVDDDQLCAYIATGEPMDKAGAYGIQGGAARFVRRIEGSYTNVVGLPLYETVRELSSLSSEGVDGIASSTTAS